MSPFAIIAFVVIMVVAMGVETRSILKRFQQMESNPEAAVSRDPELRQRAQNMMILHFAIRIVQLALLASPLYVQPSMTGWLIVGVLLIASIGLDRWADSVHRRLLAQGVK